MKKIASGTKRALGWLASKAGKAALWLLVGVVLAGVVLLALTPFGWIVLLSIGYIALRWGPKLAELSYRNLEAIDFGQKERFGMRTGEPLFEGLHRVVPWAEKIQVDSLKLRTAPVALEFTAGDKYHIRVEGTLQWRPDPRIRRDGKVLFFEMTEETINTGVLSSVKSKLGALGGVTDGESFYRHRHALGDIINAFLRLEVPPHLRHTEICSRQDCEWADEKRIEAEHLIAWYDLHWREIKDAEPKMRRSKTLDEGSGPDNPDRYKGGSGTHSQEESRYGIYIEFFGLDDVRFTEKSQQDMEREQQFEQRAKTGETYLELVQKFVDAGYSPEAAANRAELILFPEIAEKKQVYSVEGLDSLFGKSNDTGIQELRRLAGQLLNGKE